MQTFVFVGDTHVGSELASNVLEGGLRAASGVADADIVFSYTPFLEDTEDVYFGTDGLVSCAKSGAYLVNLSLATPSLSQEISALCQVNDLHYIEAPLFVHDVSREHAFADKGNVSAFLGCDEPVGEAVLAVLETVCSRVEACGATGFAQLAACASVMQRAAGVVGLVEADALCRVLEGDNKAALCMDHSLSVLNQPESVMSLFAAITNRAFVGSYTASAMIGELACALLAADDRDLILPQAEAAEYLLHMLYTLGGQDMSPAAIALLYTEESEAAQHGLDWSRADEALEAMGDMHGEYDDWDDSWDDDDDYGHGIGHHHHDHGFGLN